MDHLDKPILIHLCKDGTVTYRTREEKIFNNAALPIFSVDTVDEAETLQILLCKVQYEHHPQLPGKPWYVLSPIYGFNGNVSELDRITKLFQDAYERIKNRPKINS